MSFRFRSGNVPLRLFVAFAVALPSVLGSTAVVCVGADGHVGLKGLDDQCCAGSEVDAAVAPRDPGHEQQVTARHSRCCTDLTVYLAPNAVCLNRPRRSPEIGAKSPPCLPSKWADHLASFKPTLAARSRAPAVADTAIPLYLAVGAFLL